MLQISTHMLRELQQLEGPVTNRESINSTVLYLLRYLNRYLLIGNDYNK